MTAGNRRPRMTLKVSLPGDQSRIRQAILYVAKQCERAEHFGAIKLNKIIWKADFDSFAERGVPVTGREYRRQKFGPVLRELVPVRREMLQEGLIRIQRVRMGTDEKGRPIFEERAVVEGTPLISLLSAEDKKFLDHSISHYWFMTGEESSDESHGVAWKTRSDGDPMPYELSLLSDEPLPAKQLERIKHLIYERGWISE